MPTAYKRLTKAEARLWISEAWGMPISINNVRLRGDWLFVRQPDDDEIDCIYRPMNGDISGEPWDSIRLEDSPFLPRNKEAVETAVAKLDAGFAAYMAEIRESYGIDEEGSDGI